MYKRWLAEGWECIKSDTIQRCCIKPGIIDSNNVVVTSQISDGEDPVTDHDTEDAGQANLEVPVS